MLNTWISALGRRLAQPLIHLSGRKIPVEVKCRLAYSANDPREEEYYSVKIENLAGEKIQLAEVWYESNSGNKIPYSDVKSPLPMVIRANRVKEIRFPSALIKKLGDKNPEKKFRVKIYGDETVYRSLKDESMEAVGLTAG